jgi:hypothetical protein
MTVVTEDSSDTGAVSILDTACGYGRAGMSVFPVHFNPGAADDKAPMPGYLWQERASVVVAHIVDDFDLAIQTWGESNVSVSWALGQDGYMAIDLDQPEEPEWWDAVNYAGITNVTKRGVHLIFKNPPGMSPSNSTAQFPTRGWGDIRGAGGYIVVAGPDRPGFDAEQIAAAQPFPRPEWLSEYGGGALAVSSKGVTDFATAHNTSSDLQSERLKLNGIVGAIDKFMRDWKGESGNRHELCQWLLTTAAEESLRGYYPFKAAVVLIREWWIDVMKAEPQRHSREFEAMCRWAVGRALSKAPTAPNPTDDETQAETPGLSLVDDNTDPVAHITMVDWPTLWTTERAAEDWIVEQLWPKGRSILLHAPAKEGKSELALYCVACLALGVDPWSRLAIEPVRVLYLDYEMTENDLLDRLQDFGIGPEHDLSNLRYALLPLIAPLDTARGAKELAALVEREHPDCVVIDTFGRAVEGEENLADTVRDFYRLTGVVLKRAGVPYARTDHTGKDRKQGVRGSSAKNDDVDIVWSMERTSKGTRLTSRSRVSWVPKTLDLDRLSDPTLRYSPPVSIAGMAPDAAVTAKVYELNELDLPIEWGRDRVRVALVDAGRQPGDNNTLAKAITYRRDAARRGVVVKRPTGLHVVVDNSASQAHELSADRSDDVDQ